MTSSEILRLLRGSDRRSIGSSNEVAGLVLKQPKLFRELVSCLWHDDPNVRMRAADAAEKVSAKRPELLQPHKTELLGLLAEATQIELRWHLAQMVPRLKLTPDERQRAATALRLYLDDRSFIVKTFTLQALFDLVHNNSASRETVRLLLADALRSGSPAMKARARNLLKNLSPG